jgi:RNA-binding protein YlmH
LCDNDSTISIRGSGRFTFRGVIRHTRKDRVVVGFSQDI